MLYAGSICSVQLDEACIWSGAGLDWKPQVKCRVTEAGQMRVSTQMAYGHAEHSQDITALVWTSCTSVDALSGGRAMSHWCCLLIRSLQETSTSEILCGISSFLLSQRAFTSETEEIDHGIIPTWAMDLPYWWNNQIKDSVNCQLTEAKRLRSAKIETTKAPWVCDRKNMIITGYLIICLLSGTSLSQFCMSQFPVVLKASGSNQCEHPLPPAEYSSQLCSHQWLHLTAITQFCF